MEKGHYIYEVFTYDLWGNPKDGFQVNDVYSTGIRDLVICEDAKDKDVIRYLKKAGVLNPKDHFKSFDIFGEPDYALYIEKNGIPVCELQAMN